MPLRIQSGEMRLPGLAIRRKSLLSRQNSLVLPNTAPQVPTEIVDSVIECYVIAFSPPLAIPAIESQTTVFTKYISPCTLVSKDFRFLVLRSFFRSLSMSTSDDFRSLLGFLEQIDSQYHTNGLTGGYSWVRFVLELLCRIRVPFSYKGEMLKCRAYMQVLERSSIYDTSQRPGAPKITTASCSSC